MAGDANRSGNQEFERRKMRTIRRILFWVLSCTWGIVMTLVGAFVTLALLITGHKPHKFGCTIYFEVKKASGAFSCGPFTVTPPYQSRRLLSHEAGHAIQNIMYGPLMPFIVSLPSVIRFYHRARIQKKNPQAQLSDYDSIWFEAQATKLGIRHFM